MQEIECVGYKRERGRRSSFVDMSRARHWCFTLNNFSEENVAALRALGDSEDCRYLVFGREVGRSGTPHLQGYVAFSRKRTLRRAVDAVGSGAHLEVMRGTPSEASEYCKKDGAFEEFGEVPGGRGSRSDLKSALQAIKRGISKSSLIESHSIAYARAHRMLTEYALLNAPARNWETVVQVYWGQTGTGKTRKAFEEAKEPYVHPGGGWFDGYDGQEAVIFDDFGGSEFKITYLLKLLDRYPMRVPVKGGFVQWVPKRIWITSNYPPEQWYPNAKDEHVNALKRRITQCVRFRRLGDVVALGEDEVEVIVS